MTHSKLIIILMKSKPSIDVGKWKYEKSDALPDYGLMVSERAKKYGISIDLPAIVDPGSDTLVLQYDVRFQQGLECGGAYLKFLLPQVHFHDL
jgi:calnexin